MVVRLDKEDDCFMIPTIVICKIKRINKTNVLLAFLKWSIVFIL